MESQATPTTTNDNGNATAMSLLRLMPALPVSLLGVALLACATPTHAHREQVVSDCVSTYMKRGCNFSFCSREDERDSDVCHVRENSWFRDRDLGGFAHGRNVPQGRYFYVHNVINAVIRSRGRRHASVSSRCIMDFRSHQDYRDYLLRSDDKGFYDHYKERRGIDLEGIDHCFVNTGRGVRTITLEQLLNRMNHASRVQSGNPIQVCYAIAAGDYGYGDAYGRTRAEAKRQAVTNCRFFTRNCRVRSVTCG